MKGELKLTQLQDRFCFYMACGYSQSMSAKKAGYTGNGMPQKGYELMKNERVRAKIEDYRESGVSDDGISSEYDMMMLLTRIINGQMKEEVMSASGKTVVKDVDANTKIKAIKLMLDRFPDAEKRAKIAKLKAETDGKINNSFQIEVVKSSKEISDILAGTDNDE